MTSVKVNQITSRDNGHGRNAFLNVEEEDGRIEVWGSPYKHPTYLLQSGIDFRLIQFDDHEWVHEFFERYGQGYAVWEITDNGPVPVTVTL